MAVFTTSLKYSAVALLFCLTAGAVEAQAPKPAAAATAAKPAAAVKHTPIGMGMKDKLNFVGKYKMETGSVLEISLASGQLVAAVGNETGSFISPESPTQFFYNKMDVQIAFTLDKKGKAKSLVMKKGARAIAATRIP